MLDADEKPLLASLAHAQLAEVCAAAGVDAPTATLLRAAAASNDGGGSPRAQQLAARSSSGAAATAGADAAAAAAAAGALCGRHAARECVGRGGAPLHLLEALRLEAAADGAAEQPGKDIPEMPPLGAALHSERLALAFARVPLRRRCRRAARQRRFNRRAARGARRPRSSSSAPPRFLLGRCAPAAAALKFPLPKCAAAVAAAAPPRSLP